jgi:hypothetical protein
LDLCHLDALLLALRIFLIHIDVTQDCGISRIRTYDMARAVHDGHLPDEEGTDPHGAVQPDAPPEDANRYQQSAITSDDTKEEETKKKELGKLKKIWDKLGLDAGTLGRS